MNTQKTTYLVTGAAGFIGSRFVARCNQLGIAVISVDKPAHFEARTEHKGLDYGTIVDREKLMDWLKNGVGAGAAQNISCIVHLGACTDTMEMDQAYLARVNTEYSKDLWRYASQNKIPMVYASSAATYGQGELGYTDDESLMAKLKPLNPYGSSKLEFDLWALEQEKQGILPSYWSGFKFFNVYGFGERHKGKMASVVVHGFDQIKATSKVRLFKSHKPGILDGHQKRDFIYVEDLVDVLLFAIQKPIKRGIYNLGTGLARTFLDLALATFKSLGVPQNIEFFDTPVQLRERYQYFTQADMTKLRSVGYTKPFTSLEDGVAAYVKMLLQK